MLNRFLLIISFCLIIVFTTKVNAQEDSFELLGSVHELTNKLPISNVYIEVYGTDGSFYTCATDNLGNYSLKNKLSRKVSKYKIEFKLTNRITEFAEIKPDTVLLNRLIFNYEMKPGKTIVDRFFDYKDCTFDNCSSKISEVFSSQLLDLVITLSENPWLILEIKGFIDNEEFKQGCFKIGKERSDQVCSFLVNHGIDRERLKCIYVLTPQPVKIEGNDNVFESGSILNAGFIQSLESNEKKQLAQLYNRRVELSIIGTNYKSK